MLQGRWCEAGWWLIRNGEVLSVSRNVEPDNPGKKTIADLKRAYKTQMDKLSPAEEGGIFSAGVEDMPALPTKPSKAIEAEMVWKNKFHTGGDGKRRKTHMESDYSQGGVHVSFRIACFGGHLTTKRYWLTITDKSRAVEEEMLQVRFPTVKAAKAWALAFMGGGAVLNYHMLLALYS